MSGFNIAEFIVCLLILWNVYHFKVTVESNQARHLDKMEK